MKKYLVIGLLILIGTNIAVLAGVFFNRAGEVTSQLTLTERELALSYNSVAEKENSGISLSINWRTPTQEDNRYYPYNPKKITISKERLLALGFNESHKKISHWSTSRELYWALEFDGALHKAEIAKAKAQFKAALVADQEHTSKDSRQKVERLKNNYDREKNTKSRLFFMDASADYESLVKQFSGKKNILIVKGLAQYYVNTKEKSYDLSLQYLSIANVMVPLKHAGVFTALSRIARHDIQLPRYAATIKWGSRLEPWMVSTTRLNDTAHAK